MYSTLSDIQREVVFNKSGKFVVRACPGSGKTYCVAARLRRLLSEWDERYKGVVAISFTNTAWQEIDRMVSNEFAYCKGIGFPHFIGTIDSFINRYIFLPHGHLVLGCNKRPILVGEPHGIWSSPFYYDGLFDNISFDISGSPYAHNKKIMPKEWESNEQLRNKKATLNIRGFATQSDANYFAMLILERFPQIAQAIALRFPYFIIDEAQDTSDIQMRIIDNLIKNGLEEIMLVGDPDQAIFEWNEARPDMFNNKYKEWESSIELNENRRSSQNICNITYNLSSLSSESESVNVEVKDYSHKPQVVVYNNNLPQIVEQFLLECEKNKIEISKENVSVLYRSKNVKNDIFQIPKIDFKGDIWEKECYYTKDFAKGKFLYDNGFFKEGVKLIEKAFVKYKKQLSYCDEKTMTDFINRYGFIKFRIFIYKLINEVLPETDGITLGEWINEANENFEQRNTNFTFKCTRKGASYSFEQIFIEKDFTKDVNYRIGTIHSVKGETFDASLVILKKRGICKYYTTLLRDNIPICDSEELRIAYVGMTRPRKVLVIAVPDEDNKIEWENKLKIDESEE